MRLVARLGSVSLLALIASSPAYAQSTAGPASSPATAPTQDDATDASGAGLGDIVVTAQRRAESEVNVPMAITVVGAQALQDQGITDLATLQQSVPGLQVISASGNNQPTIRGVGTQIASAGLPANVATYVDGFYRPIQLTTNVPLQGVDSVEVLKGPQGSLYGRNATGGAILVNARGPSSTPRGEIYGSYGSKDEVIASAFLGGPIGGGLSGSLFGYLNDGDGFYHADAERFDTGHSTRLVRGKLRLEPASNLRFDLSLEYTNVDDPGVQAYSAYRGQASLALVPGAIVSTKPRHYSADYKPVYNFNAYGAFFKVTLDTSIAQIIAQTGYEDVKADRAFDIDLSSLPVLHISYGQKERVFQQELNFISNGTGPFTWTAGLSYLYDDAHQLPVTIVTLTPPVNSVDGTQKQDSFAVYAEGTYDLTDVLSLTAGGRYSKDKFRYSAFSDLGPPAAGRTSQDAFTPRVTLRYKPADRAQIYAAFNQGYKAGGFNTTAVSNVPVRPERITAYEIGAKLDRRVVQIEAAAYYYDYKNIQVNAFQGVTSFLLNAARSKIYGAEGHLAAALTPGLTLDLSASYNHARFESFPTAVRYAFDPTAGIVISSGDAKDNPLPVSPDFTAFGGLTYATDLGSGTLKLNGSVFFATRTTYDSFEQIVQPSYAVVNGRISYAGADSRWEIGAFIKNATDHDYLITGVPEPTALAVRYADPLRVGVDLRFRLF